MRCERAQAKGSSRAVTGAGQVGDASIAMSLFPVSSRIVGAKVWRSIGADRGSDMPHKYALTLSVEDGHTVDPARAATALARELVREGVSVTTANGPAPENAKSGIAISAGSLIISGAVSAQAVRSITQIVMTAMRRGLAGQIHLEDGDRKIDVGNASRDTERALVAWLNSSNASEPGGE
jgi:hypothetical protein